VKWKSLLRTFDSIPENEKRIKVGLLYGHGLMTLSLRSIAQTICSKKWGDDLAWQISPVVILTTSPV